MTVIDFFVAGQPVPQGSVKAFTNSRTGRPILTSTGGQNLKAWRQRIATEAQRASDQMEAVPVAVLAHFLLERPKSRRASKHPWPDVTPDVDKLLRSALDGITKVLLDDDKRVCVAVPIKTYASPGHPPGVRVLMRPLWPQEADEPWGVVIQLAEYARTTVGASQTA